MTEMIPTIETARLRLRGHRVDDLDVMAAMWGDPAVVRHIRPTPFAREEVWSRLHRYVGHWALLGFGSWLVEEKAGGGFVGEVGLFDFRRDMDPPFGDAPEAGWVLSPATHGKGYATEAVQAALAWGRGHFGARRTVCMIDPQNAASIRVAEKCGYREYARSTYHGEASVLLERTL